jgi:hypothetical protein
LLFGRIGRTEETAAPWNRQGCGVEPRRGRKSPENFTRSAGSDGRPSRAVCHLSDPRVPHRHRLADALVTFCANHAAIAGRRALTLDTLRFEVTPASERRINGRAHETFAPSGARVFEPERHAMTSARTAFALPSW